MIGSDLKTQLYYQLLHHVESMEKLREKHKINQVDFDQILNVMKEEYRRANVLNQAKLSAAYAQIGRLENAE
jgi:hypothetical protein